MKKQSVSILMILAVIFCMLTMNIGGISVNAASVEFSRTSINLYALETYRLGLKNPASNVKFVSSDEKIVSVNEEGIVTAVSSGNAEIYAMVGTDIKSVCKVKVITGNAPTDITINEQNLNMTEGDTFKLKATVSPDDTTDKSVYYSSSDTSVAKVDKNGTVTALKAGVAVITVEASSSAVSKKCVVKVISKTDKSNTRVNINGVLYSVTGERKKNMTVVVKSATETISATTDDEGKFYLEDIENGKYKMTVYRDENMTKSVCSEDITVFAYDMNISCIINDSTLVVLYQEEKVSTDKIKDITLDSTTLALDSGSSYDMTYKVTPANVGTPTLRGVSSDTNIVTVDSDGRITGVSGGKATVTFSTLDGKISRKCIVTVNETNSSEHSLTIILAEMFIVALGLMIFFAKYKKFRLQKEAQEEREERENERSRRQIYENENNEDIE